MPAETSLALRTLPTLETGRWVVVASGGTRLMLVGAALAAAARPDLVLVDREGPGSWQEIGADGVMHPLSNIDHRALDAFALRDLVTATWSDDERRIHVDGRATPPEVDAFADECIRGRHWKPCFEGLLRALRASGRPAQPGLVFESFVAALMRHLGVGADDVEVGVCLVDGETRVQEVDVVVNSAGRLHVIDCKLRDDEDEAQAALGTQVREADTTRRQIGDGCGQHILLRPHRVFGEEITALCRAYDIQVVDQAVLEERHLPDVLAQLLRTPGNPAPATASSRPGPALPSAIDGLGVDLYRHLRESGRSWMHADLGARVLLLCAFEQGITSSRFRSLLLQKLGRTANLVEVHVSGSGKSGHAVLAPSDVAQFRQRISEIPSDAWA